MSLQGKVTSSNSTSECKSRAAEQQSRRCMCWFDLEVSDDSFSLVVSLRNFSTVFFMCHEWQQRSVRGSGEIQPSETSKWPSE